MLARLFPIRSRTLRAALLLGLLIGVAVPLQAAESPAAARPAEKNAEETYKNIVVFKGVPARQIDGAMAFMSASLGVGCAHCHVVGKDPSKSEWESDEKQEKKTARAMVEMVRSINKQNFAGHDVVTCATCHQGHPEPNRLPPVDQIAARKVNEAAEEAEKSAVPLPAVSDILGAYSKALGGEAALAAVTSQRVKATSVGSDGKIAKQEFTRKAPNKLLLVSHLPDGSATQAYDGTTGWVKSAKGEREISGPALLQLKRSAEFRGDTKLENQFKKLSVAGRENWNGHDTLVLRGVAASDEHGERLWFDAKSGLLLRRDVYTKTLLGSIPDESDYEDYRDVKGVKIPFTVRRTSQWMNLTRKVDEIVQNPTIDDAVFKKPAPAKN